MPMEDRTLSIGLHLKPLERARLEDRARTNGLPSMSAAIRDALPDVFHEHAREGRKPGYSPKRKTI
jgi:hypothetical protein